ncbi:MAG TPA: HAMP domain-containing sensor histidine kinase, partial [Bacteroidia bacterium]|nr:HAMP domain-containing sensor histidine kinase [Bacteroidia bacterium]
MNIYSRKQRWKIFLLIGAAIIIVASHWYTSLLVKKISDDERRKVRLWADAIQRKASLVKYTNELFQKIEGEERQNIKLWAEANKQLSLNLSDYTFVLDVIRSNQTIPVIITDENGRLLLSKNVDSTILSDKKNIRDEVELMRQQHRPIEIEILPGKKNYLYYKDSKLFQELKIVFDGLIKSFISEVAVNSASVPVIYTDSTQTNVIAYGNLDTLKINDSEFVLSTLKEMEAQNTPIEVDLGDGARNYIFYKESFLLTQLRYYPYIQFGVIGIFLLISYLLFNTARRAEQDQVWLGMAKETAHQLGTPLSSIIAWLEYLKLKGVDEQSLLEAREDVRRLETITERFSKIGSIPVLEKANIIEVLNKAVAYMRTRTSKSVSFSVQSVASHDIYVKLNIPLFEWVVENICRNSIDAMDGKGTIVVEVLDHLQYVYIDVTDSGKGIARSNFKTIFQPGYTTKQRGWGLGLSLVRRIVENYHQGKIFVKKSE